MRQDNDTLSPRQFELKQVGVIDLKRSQKMPVKNDVIVQRISLQFLAT